MLTKNKTDFTEGTIFWKMTAFAIPIMLTGLLQILYNVADNIVIGRFSGDASALGAVGSSAILCTLIINLLVGVSSGTGVAVAQAYGAKDDNLVSKIVHTAMAFAVVSGIACMIFGLLITRPALLLMKTREEFFENAVLYVRIICLGVPASAIFNFGAAILRSIGNSRIPLIVLASSGLLNVLLNLLFVVGFNMSVAGVALATIASQYASAIFVLIALIRNGDECYGLSRKKYVFDGKTLARILRLGIPAGIQSCAFTISNIYTMVCINTLSDAAVTANTIAANIDSVCSAVASAFFQTVMTFTGQNFGAKKPERMKKALIYGIIQAVSLIFIISQTILFFGEEIAGLYISPDEANKSLLLSEAMSLMSLMLTFFFLVGITESLSGFIRGLGYSIIPMINSIVGTCGVRMIWLIFAFPLERFNTLRGSNIGYPISWAAVIVMNGVACIYAWLKYKKQSRVKTP